MALGTSSFSLIEVVGSFGAICGNGIAVIPYGINKVKLRNDVEIWQRDSPRRKEVIPKNVLTKTKKLLRNVIKEGTGKGFQKYLSILLEKLERVRETEMLGLLGVLKTML